MPFRKENKHMKKLALLLSLCMAFSAAPLALADEETAPESAENAGVIVNVTVPEDYDGELNGRLLFLVDKDLSAEDLAEGEEVFYNIDVTGCYVAGKTVFGVQPGDVISMTIDDPEVYGYPMQLADLPDGEYAVQAFFIKYTEFNRKDGTTIWAMADHGGGGSITSNPYNLYSDSMMVTVGEGAVELTLSNEIPLGYELAEGQVDQQGNYEDKELVKYVKIKSEVLSDFWGTDIYIGANVLLPANYDPEKKYPVLYYQGHWPGGSVPLSYGSTRSASQKAFTEYWDSGEAPDMIVVTTRDATMFYDTSYSVNSANQGPWGDAYINELIPYIEETFHAVGEPWARLLAGGSTGGWEAMALQIFYPDFFGGTWPMCPDGMDFHAYQIVDLYNDENAYYIDNGWTKTERPSARDTKGNILWTIEQENHYEIALGGLEAVSLGQWAIWEAVYSPMDEDGYPARVWDPITGDINPDVVSYWQENYDLNYIMQTNWETLGEKLIGKIHLRGGDMDNYYLNLSQYRVAEFLDSTGIDYGYSVTFPRTGHSGSISNHDLLEEMAEHMIKYGPENAAEILGR